MRITADIIRRVESGNTALTAPCVLCGGALPVTRYVPGKGHVWLEGHGPADVCGHDVDETEQAIKIVKRLSKEKRAAILAE